MKPDLVAPAGGILSLAPLPHDRRGNLVRFVPGKHGTPEGLWCEEEWEPALKNETVRSRLARAGYTRKSGTSMSTPMVAGAVCLLLQKEPALTPDAVRHRLRQSATDLGLPRNQQGGGMLDIRRLLEL